MNNLSRQGSEAMSLDPIPSMIAVKHPEVAGIPSNDMAAIRTAADVVVSGRGLEFKDDRGKHGGRFLHPDHDLSRAIWNQLIAGNNFLDRNKQNRKGKGGTGIGNNLDPIPFLWPRGKHTREHITNQVRHAGLQEKKLHSSHVGWHAVNL